MPQQDFIDSIKARLYDFKYTPFMSSFVFAWIYWNSKSILIFFSDKLSVNEKINMLSYDLINHEYPFYFALFYVFVFPVATAFFYGATLGYRLVMNTIQQKIQDKTPLPQEDAKKIIRENAKIQLELDISLTQVEKIKADYALRKEALNNNFNNKVKTEVESRVKEELTNLNKELERSNNSLMNKIDEVEVKKATINDLQSELKAIKKYTPIGIVGKSKENNISTQPMKSEDSLIEELSDNEKGILKTYNEHDVSLKVHNIKEIMKEDFLINKPKTEQDLDNLKILKILETNSSSAGDLKLTKLGLNIVNKLFNNK